MQPVNRVVNNCISLVFFFFFFPQLLQALRSSELAKDRPQHRPHHHHCNPGPRVTFREEQFVQCYIHGFRRRYVPAVPTLPCRAAAAPCFCHTFAQALQSWPFLPQHSEKIYQRLQKEGKRLLNVAYLAKVGHTPNFLTLALYIYSVSAQLHCF